jgi:hypothetical protein
MSQSEAKASEVKSKEKTSADVKIAIIGAIATVVVALLGVDAIWTHLLNKPDPTPVSVSTDVPFSATNSPFAPTLTPELSCTLNRNCPASVDWANECIASYNWTIYSSSEFPELSRDENGCYSQPILDAFYTKDDGLYRFAQPTALTSSKDYGLFTQLPQSGNVTITLDLDKIDNGHVWIGIFEKADVHSAGALLVVPPGDVRNQAFALKTMPSERKIEVSRLFENPLGKYTLGFELEFGSIIANVEGVSMTPIPFTPRTRWLFIGYRAKLDNPINGTADIQALFTDLKIEQ